MKALIKQYIILRKDAPTVSGEPVSAAKLAVMTAHASIAFLTDIIENNKSIDEDTKKWFDTGYTKVLLGAKTKDFLKIKEKALAMNFKENDDFFEIYDLCNTELLHDENSNTCYIVIGFKPMEEEKIKPLVKRFQIYK